MARQEISICRNPNAARAEHARLNYTSWPEKPITMFQLAALSDRELLAMPNLGRETLRWIRENFGDSEEENRRWLANGKRMKKQEKAFALWIESIMTQGPISNSDPPRQPIDTP